MAATGGAAQIEVTRLTVDQTLSSRINLMRILLIGGIVFVHVPYDAQTSPFFTGAFGLFDWLRVFLGESLFRIGVPCLSAISGYLLFRRGYAGFDYGKTLRTKATTVLTPFLLWNLGLLLAVLLIQSVSLGIGYFPDLWRASPRDLLSHGLALEGFPVNLPLYFLRDLLVCILLSPILAYLVRRAPVATCAALFILAVLPGVTIGIVLKKSILFSFTFGMALALHGRDTRALDRYRLLGAAGTLALAALLAIGLYGTGPQYPLWLDLARNILSILGALGVWLLSGMLIETRFGRTLAGTGSLSFWIFCGHYPLLVGLWMVWNRMAGDSNYPAFYLAAITATFVILFLTNHIIERLAPAAYRVLTGSRARDRRGAVLQAAPGSKANETPAGAALRPKRGEA